MSVFKANKGHLSAATTIMESAKGYAEEQADINFGRQLLSNIREYRAQQSVLDLHSQAAEGIVSSSDITATSSARQQFAEPVARAYEDTARQEKIESLQQQAQSHVKKFKKQAKTARTTGYVTAAVLGIAGGFLGAGLVSGAAAAAGASATTTSLTLGAVGGSLAGGGIASGVGAIAGADSNFQSGAVRGTITSSMIMGTAAGGGLLGGGEAAAGTTAGGVETFGNGSFTMEGSIGVVGEGNGALAALDSIKNMTGSQWMATGTILKTIGGAVKDINGYTPKVPVSTSYVGNYSQYVQSFRGFI